MEEDLYKILGVSKDADESAIKKAYRTIARENHPDLNPDDKGREEKFKSASHAFEVLSDPERRKLYDEFGHMGLREGFNAEQARQYQRWQGSGGGGGRYQAGGNFEDIFGNIFGGRSPFDTSDFSNFGGFYGGPMKGQDIEATLDLDFMTAIRGGEMEIGIGGRTIKVRVPAGADDGERLRLKGQGHPAPAQAQGKGSKGDLILTLQVKAHPILRREGLNLSLDLPVTMAEAITGTKLDVPTPHGEFKVTIPSGVNSGARLRLKEKGVHRGSKKGDFFVVIQVHAPDVISDEMRDMAQKIAEGYSRNVREGITL